ncbi:MAG: tRNA lysidine(34) synthetase TilS [Gudongella sp.]|nr:tRNA lysidine(34) synthetase TilS [Gudongella sp.]
METVFKSNIISKNLIKPGETILAAISGGPDSMAMLNCLVSFKKDLDFNILIAHVNHGVRGEYAKRDQDFVKKIALEYDIPYFTIDVDMVAYGKELGISSEEAGRILRYGFFREVLADYGGGKIAVAHNKNDQAETILHRIIRGTGLDGLKSMEFIRGDIIRPLLNISRKEIEDYIEEKNIPFVIDHTNLETDYTRNKIRLELLPYIEKNFNPNIIDSLYRLTGIATGEIEIIEEITIEKYNLIVKSETKNSIIFNGILFSQQPKAIRKRLIRKAIENITGNLHGVEEIHINDIIDLFYNSKTGKSVDISKGLIAKVSYNDLIIQLRNHISTSLESKTIQFGETRLEKLGIMISLELIRVDQINLKDNKFKYIDFDAISGNLSVRTRKSGDIFSPLGLGGSKKLKDYMIDKKIPRDKRDLVAILCDNSGIIWVIGYGLSDNYKITEKTKQAIRIEVKKI